MNKTILHIRSSGGFLGAENVVIELCKQAKQNGLEAIAGAINNTSDPYPEFLKIAEALNIRTVLFECNGQFDLNCARNIKNFVRENNVDLVHAHGYKEDFYIVLTNAKIPKIATNHLWKKNNFRDRLYCLLDCFLLKRFDYVVGVSDEIVKELQNLSIMNVVKINNGIDLSKFVNKKKSKGHFDEFGFIEPTLIVGMISSITNEKGHIYALDAFVKIIQKKINTKLLIVGVGNKFEEIKHYSSKLGLDGHVLFAGKRSDIPEVLSIMDIFIIPSLKEGLPMALLEAMASKKAVIATSVGEIPNVIENNEKWNSYKVTRCAGFGICFGIFVDMRKKTQ